MTRTIIDIHVVQTVPPSNINRDDTGSPKTAVYGGTRRARVSSQAWKRAVRNDFRAHLDASELGWRTKEIVERLASSISDLAPDLKTAAPELAAAALKGAGITTNSPKGKDAEMAEAGYLVFLSNTQYDNLAAAVVKAEGIGEKLGAKAAKSIVKTDHSIDVALFGRMVADSADLNVDAACQVAHAISTHAVQTEFDYYTAVDDTKEREELTGAGMIGTVEFNSATLYRYATVDVDNLLENLGDRQATARAVEAFVRSFVTSMPTGKQNSFANRTLPDLVAVRLRATQSINLVGAFESPIGVQQSEGRVRASLVRLAAHTDELEVAFSEAPEHAWFTAVGASADGLDGFGEKLPFSDLTATVRSAVEGRLGAQ